MLKLLIPTALIWGAVGMLVYAIRYTKPPRPMPRKRKAPLRLYRRF